MSLAYIFDEISVVTILDFILLRKHENMNRNIYQSFLLFFAYDNLIVLQFYYLASNISNQLVEFVKHKELLFFYELVVFNKQLCT